MEENWEDFPLFAPEGVEIPKITDGTSGEDISSALGALSHLLYDEETPEEISEHLRDAGNRLFRRGRRYYKSAIEKYTEAINAKCEIPEVTAAAYSNRAAAELKLRNFGRCLADSEACLNLQPDNVKARYRAALSATAIQRFDKAIAHCDKGIELFKGTSKESKEQVALFEKAKQNARSLKEKEERKLEAMEEKKVSEEHAESRRREMLMKRGIKMGLALFGQQRSYSRTTPKMTENEVSWPVLLLYPEEAVGGPGAGDQSDYLEEVHEDTIILDILRTVFPSGAGGPEWDKRRAYDDYSKLEVLFRADWTMTQEEADSDDEINYVGSVRGPDEVGSWRTLKTTDTLRQVLSTKGYVVPLFPVFYVVPKGTYLS